MSTVNLDVIGEEKIAYLLRMAPETFTKQVELWMHREKVAFVGGPNKNGRFTKELLKKPRKYRSGGWSQFVARAFTGVVDNESNLNAMQLRMGLVRQERLKDLPFMEALGFGSDNKPSNKEWLMIPNYKNIFAAGLYGRYGARGKNNFSKLLANLYDKHIAPVLYHGKLLMFGDFPDGSADGKKLTGWEGHVLRHQHTMNRKLLFTGVKNTRMDRQFNLEASWDKRLPSVMKHGGSMIERTVRSLERGYLEVK